MFVYNRVTFEKLELSQGTILIQAAVRVEENNLFAT